MAPRIPHTVTAGQNPVVSFGGALITEFLEPPPGRCFAFRQTYKLKAPPGIDFEAVNKPSGPPLHLHPWQNEWFRCVAGRMAVEIDGEMRILAPEDGEVMGRAGCVHRFWLAPDSIEDMAIVLSASDTGDDYMLDRVFFDNWYGLWHDAVVHHGGEFDLIQLLCTYDGGDAYLVPDLALPMWARKFIGYWGGIIVGRYIGGLLGYKPFLKEYTTDWDLAVAKMRSHWVLWWVSTRAAAWADGGTTDKYAARAKLNGANGTSGVNGTKKDE